MQAAGQVGGMLGPVIGGLVASQVGLTASFLISTGIALAMAAIVSTTVVPDRPTAAERTAGRGSLREAFARPQQRRLMLLLLAGDAAIQGLRPLIPVVVASRGGDEASVAAASGLAVTLVSGGGVIASLIVGRLSQRVEPRRILLVAMPLAVALVALVPAANELWTLIAVWVLAAFCVDAVTPSIYGWLGRLGARGGSAFALLAMTHMLGFAVGPIVRGQATTFGLGAPFVLAAALTFLGWLLVAVSRRNPVAQVPAPAL